MRIPLGFGYYVAFDPFNRGWLNDSPIPWKWGRSRGGKFGHGWELQASALSTLLAGVVYYRVLHRNPDKQDVP